MLASNLVLFYCVTVKPLGTNCMSRVIELSSAVPQPACAARASACSGRIGSLALQPPLVLSALEFAVSLLECLFFLFV